MFKNCAPFTKCISNEHIGSAHNLDIIMPMYKLIEYSDNYWDASGNLWQFKRDEQKIWTTETLLMLLQLIHDPLNTN